MVIVAALPPVGEVLAHQRDGTRCQWRIDRGYNKGVYCGNDAAFILRGGLFFCHLHAGMALDDARFAKQLEPVKWRRQAC